MLTFREFSNTDAPLSSAARMNIQRLSNEIAKFHRNMLSDRLCSAADKRLVQMLADLSSIVITAITGEYNPNGF